MENNLFTKQNSPLLCFDQTPPSSSPVALLQLEVCVTSSLLVLVPLPNARAKNIRANKAEWVQPSNSNSSVAVKHCHNCSCHFVISRKKNFSPQHTWNWWKSIRVPHNWTDAKRRRCFNGTRACAPWRSFPEPEKKKKY